MNKIRERVLTDSGWVDVTQQEKRDSHVVIAELSGKVQKLTKKLQDVDKMWEERRSVEMIALKDENSDLKNTVRKLKKDMEALNKRVAKPKEKK